MQPGRKQAVKPIHFNNTYVNLGEGFYARTPLSPVANPTLVAYNQALGDALGLSDTCLDSPGATAIFAGNRVPEGAEPVAMAYAGHQFGNFVPQLGDGRALLLGQVVAPDGAHHDIHLKGSGRTVFSRGGDGRAALGPVLREYLVSEAMAKLGVPTTRALAAVTTGEQVARQEFLPGGVITRTAGSFVRVGTFEFFASRGDRTAVTRLADYVIERLYPACREAASPCLALLEAVIRRQAALVAQWMQFGFIHGVMNTDNTAVSGETLDYGPCAFLDEFDIDKVFSSIDHRGRYAYGNQANIAIWNLSRLADCLLQLDPEPAPYQEALEQFQPCFEQHYFALMRRRLGLVDESPDDPALVTGWLQQLQDRRLDYHLSFQRLRHRLRADDSGSFGEFEVHWRSRIAGQPGGAGAAEQLMRGANPVYVPRNHQIERAIQAALADDFQPFEALQQVLAEPFAERSGLEQYTLPPRDDERVQVTFCGT